MRSRQRTSCGICSGCRKPRSWRWQTVTHKPRASSRWLISMSRPVSATQWACSTTRRRRARPFSSPPASTSRVSTPPSRFSGLIFRPSRARWSNGPPRCIVWPICLGSCIGRRRLRWHRPPGLSSCRFPEISCAPTATSISPLRVAWRRGSGGIGQRSKRQPRCSQKQSIP